MGRLADRGVVHVEITADGANHDLAGVQPDPDLRRHPLGSPQAVGVRVTASCIRRAA